MTDPLDGLNQLQYAIDNGFNELFPCELSPELQCISDQPNGIQRFTYAEIKTGKIHAYSVFVVTENLNELPCFNIGYAVPETFRRRGFATSVLKKSIAELKNELARNNIKRFYLEAIVGTSNKASQKIANKLISQTPKECTDSESGQPALSYTRLIECS